MKKLTIILFVLALFVACQNSTKKETAKEEVAVLTVDEIQKSGEELIGKTVTVTGTVSHVCKHSGARCFLMGSSEDVTIRVEAGGSIGSFTQEQMGSDLKVTGILNEIRIDEDYLKKQEAEAMEGEALNEDHAMGHEGGGNHEVDGGNHENDQLAQIAEMRKQIEATEKRLYFDFLPGR